jgi:putative ABC transport system permease protein
MRLSLRVYRWLLRLYPAGFRETYGIPLEQQFKDDYAEVAGTSDLLKFWRRTFVDLAVSLPAQIAGEIRQDARQAVRTWRHRPLPVAFAIATLAVAIGANTGVFSVLNALLLRSLPFHEPDRLASLRHGGPGFNAAKFHAWREQTSYLEDAAAYHTLEVNGDDNVQAPARLRLTETSWNFFRLLGSQPVLGRAFAAGEDTPGRDAIAVIGYGLWQQRFGGDPRALGSTLHVNGTPLTIVGIAPPGFDFPQQTAVWSPSTFDFERIPKTDVTFLSTIGRLKSDLSWTQARQVFETEAYAQDPMSRNANAANRPALTPIREQLAGPVRSASLILMAGVALLLLMACASIANLLLGRTAARSSELMIRRALGASRARLIQQLLTESVLLSAAAAVAGLLIADWTARLATSTQPAQLAGQSYTILDWRVLAFTAAVSLVTGIVFGVGPAVCLARASAGALGRTATSNVRTGRTRQALIAVQIALSIVLFTGSIALGRAFVALLRSDNGFTIASVATMNVSLAGSVRQDNTAAYYADVFRRVREVPGVVSVSATQFLPLAVTGFMGGRFNLDATGTPVLAVQVPIAPGYFQTLGGLVMFGRDFNDQDVEGSGSVAIVNDRFARQFGEPSSAVGRYVTAERRQPRKIVGVVRAMRYDPWSEALSEVFTPSRSPNAQTIVARVNGNARDRIAAIRDAVQSVDAKVPVFNVKTMEERLDDTLARPKFYTTAVMFFGGVALLLVVIGVYGVVSYAVVQRSREMGIRLALGMTPGRLRVGVLRQGLITVALGVVPGVWGAIAGGRYLQTLVHGAAAGIVMTSAVAVGITTATAAAAIWSATRHIARLDIVEVLRAESAE